MGGAHSAREPCLACGHGHEEAAGLLDPAQGGEAPGDGHAGDEEEEELESLSSSVIQFSCATYFCTEQEREVAIDVTRLGDQSGAASVEYLTQDSSAKAGEKYEHRSGKLHFEPRETAKTVHVPIKQIDTWESTLEFKMVLRKPKNAQLGKYMSRCRVFVIDDDAFPTNKFRDHFEDNTEDMIPAFSLFIEYVQMNIGNQQVWAGTVKTIIMDQVKNLYFILCIYLQMYLVDIVLAPPEHEETEVEMAYEEEEAPHESHRLLLQTIRAGARMLHGGAEGEGGGLKPFGGALLVPDNRRATAIVVGALYIAPFVLLQIFDIQKVKYNVAGLSRIVLQSNLLRKFLHFKEEKRATMSSGDITMAMVRDVTEVVNMGYMKVLEILRIMGKLLMALVFILAENQLAVIPLIVYPVIMSLFLLFREQITIESNENQAERQNDVVKTLTEAVGSYRLLADFQLRPYMVDTYETCISHFNAAECEAKAVALNNKYLPPWLITLLIGTYFMTGPLQVDTLGGSLPLGAFLATINVFREIGHELSEIYVELMEIQKSTGPLRKVAHFMNCETSLRQRMDVNRMRIEVGQKARARARNEIRLSDGGLAVNSKGQEVLAVDMVQIEISNLRFRYKGGEDLLRGFNHRFPQGKLYAIVGDPHKGKATFLKLMGQVLMPDTGYIFVPPHLRVLHVSQETQYISASLLENIVFNQDSKEYGGLERVKRLCELVGFNAQVRSLLDQGDSGHEDYGSRGSWVAQLSHTDHARMNLLRALVMNPEFLVMHKPGICFDETEALDVVGLLRRHVEERGLELPEEGRRFRRPRSVFFTAATLSGASISDAVFEIKQDALVEISQESLKEHPEKLL